MTDPRPVRVGAIGAGWWATTNHFPHLADRSDVELVGLCSPGRDHLLRVQDKFGFRRITEDYRELLTWGLDAVIVASPHHLHHEHAGAALDSGRVVLCEKPMALTAVDAWDLVARGRGHQAPLLVAYGWNYKQFLVEAQALLTNPGVGQIQFVNVRMASPTKDFFSSARATVPSQFAAELKGPDPATWQDPLHGGGYIHGQLTHAVGLLFWLTELRALDATAHASSPNAPVELYTGALVSFADDAHGVIAGAGTLPDDDKFQVDMSIFGSNGVLLIDVERERVVLRRHDQRHKHVDAAPGAGSYSCEGPVERMLAIARDPAAGNNSSGDVAARTVELLEAIQRSATCSAHPTVRIDQSLGARGAPAAGELLTEERYRAHR